MRMRGSLGLESLNCRLKTGEPQTAMALCWKESTLEAVNGGTNISTREACPLSAPPSIVNSLQIEGTSSKRNGKAADHNLVAPVRGISLSLIMHMIFWKVLTKRAACISHPSWLVQMILGNLQHLWQVCDLEKFVDLLKWSVPRYSAG